MIAKPGKLLIILLLLAALGLSACTSTYKGRKYKRKCKPCPSFNQVPPTKSPSTFEDFAQAR
jgi:hypothetical protein